MEHHRNGLLIPFLLCALMLAALVHAPTAQAMSAQDEALPGRWVLIRDGHSQGDGLTDYSVEGMVLDIHSTGSGSWSGKIHGRGYEPCMTPGTTAIASITPAGNIDGGYSADGVLQPDCSTADEVVLLLFLGERARIQMHIDGGRWDFFKDADVPDPDEILGEWVSTTNSAGGPATDDDPPEVTVRITGEAPDYSGEVVAVADDSCFSVGEVIWPHIRWGHSGTLFDGYGGPTAVGRLCDNGGWTTWAVVIDDEGDARLTMAPDVSDGFSRSAMTLTRATSTRVANPDDFADVAGYWEIVGDDAHDVLLRWTGNPTTPFVGVVTRTPTGCPADGTTVWSVTGSAGRHTVTGDLAVYVDSGVGCELDRIVPTTFTTNRPARLRVTYDDGTGDQTAVFRKKTSLTYSGGRDEQALGVAFLTAITTDGLLNDRDADDDDDDDDQGHDGGEWPTLYLTTDANFPDGLALAGLAGRNRAATLLVDPDDPGLNAAMLGHVADQVGDIVVIGGEGVIPSSALPAPGQPGAPTGRLAGNNRFHTAQVLAEEGWPRGANTVYIATGTNFPDALAGGAAASVEGAPVLLVDDGRMPEETEAALVALDPQEIIVLGGTTAIPESIESNLRTFASVTRLAGTSRIHTAVAVSQARFPDGSDHALIVSGDRFGEALLAASVAWAFDGPLLLVGDAGLPVETAAELGRLGRPTARLLATNGTIDLGVVQALDAILPSG